MSSLGPNAFCSANKAGQLVADILANARIVNEAHMSRQDLGDGPQVLAEAIEGVRPQGWRALLRTGASSRHQSLFVRRDSEHELAVVIARALGTQWASVVQSRRDEIMSQEDRRALQKIKGEVAFTEYANGFVVRRASGHYWRWGLPTIDAAARIILDAFGPTAWRDQLKTVLHPKPVTRQAAARTSRAATSNVRKEVMLLVPC